MNIFVCQKNFCAKSSVPRPLSGERTLARGPERTARWPRLPGFWPFNRERPIRYQKIFPCQPQTAKNFRIAFPRASAVRNAVLRTEGGKKIEKIFSHGGISMWFVKRQQAVLGPGGQRRNNAPKGVPHRKETPMDSVKALSFFTLPAPTKCFPSVNIVRLPRFFPRHTHPRMRKFPHKQQSPYS